MKLKQLIKKALYSFRIFQAFHHIRNKENLTVIMLHRVLPINGSDWQLADPDWTIDSDFFEQLLTFFNKHYNVVSLEQIKTFCENQVALPPRPLLITFDDGWLDSHQYAKPILERFGLPSLIFISTSAINTPVLSWQEALDILARSKQLTVNDLRKIEQSLQIDGIVEKWGSSNDIQSIIKILNNAPNLDRQLARSTITPIFQQKQAQQLMMKSEQVKELFASQMAVGGHGHQHEPLTKLEDPKLELDTSQLKLTEWNDGIRVDSMSFPHSQYNDKIISAAASSGFSILFGGGTRLHPLNRLQKNPEVIYRVNIDQQGLADKNQKLQEDKLAHMLFCAKIG